MTKYHVDLNDLAKKIRDCTNPHIAYRSPDLTVGLVIAERLEAIAEELAEANRLRKRGVTITGESVVYHNEDPK